MTDVPPPRLLGWCDYPDAIAVANLVRSSPKMVQDPRETKGIAIDACAIVAFKDKYIRLIGIPTPTSSSPSPSLPRSQLSTPSPISTLPSLQLLFTLLAPTGAPLLDLSTAPLIHVPLPPHSPTTPYIRDDLVNVDQAGVIRVYRGGVEFACTSLGRLPACAYVHSSAFNLTPYGSDRSVIYAADVSGRVSAYASLFPQKMDCVWSVPLHLLQKLAHHFTLSPCFPSRDLSVIQYFREKYEEKQKNQASHQQVSKDQLTDTTPVVPAFPFFPIPPDVDPLAASNPFLTPLTESSFAPSTTSQPSSYTSQRSSSSANSSPSSSSTTTSSSSSSSPSPSRSLPISTPLSAPLVPICMCTVTIHSTHLPPVVQSLHLPSSYPSNRSASSPYPSSSTSSSSSSSSLPPSTSIPTSDTPPSLAYHQSLCLALSLPHPHHSSLGAIVFIDRASGTFIDAVTIPSRCLTMSHARFLPPVPLSSPSSSSSSSSLSSAIPTSELYLGCVDGSIYCIPLITTKHPFFTSLCPTPTSSSSSASSSSSSSSLSSASSPPLPSLSPLSLPRFYSVTPSHRWVNMYRIVKTETAILSISPVVVDPIKPTTYNNINKHSINTNNTNDTNNTNNTSNTSNTSNNYNPPIGEESDNCTSSQNPGISPALLFRSGEYHWGMLTLKNSSPNIKTPTSTTPLAGEEKHIVGDADDSALNTSMSQPLDNTVYHMGDMDPSTLSTSSPSSSTSSSTSSSSSSSSSSSESTYESRLRRRIEIPRYSREVDSLLGYIPVASTSSSSTSSSTSSSPSSSSSNSSSSASSSPPFSHSSDNIPIDTNPIGSSIDDSNLDNVYNSSNITVSYLKTNNDNPFRLVMYCERQVIVHVSGIMKVRSAEVMTTPHNATTNDGDGSSSPMQVNQHSSSSSSSSSPSLLNNYTSHGGYYVMVCHDMSDRLTNPRWDWVPYHDPTGELAKMFETAKKDGVEGKGCKKGREAPINDHDILITTGDNGSDDSTSDDDVLPFASQRRSRIKIYFFNS